MSIRRQFQSVFSGRQSVPRKMHLRRQLIFQMAEARCLMAADAMEYCVDGTAALQDNSAAEISVASASDDHSQTADAPSPVLMVISNQDFWYQDYGDTRSADDDVIVDGNIITAENYDSAHEFRAVIAEQVIARSLADRPAAHDSAIMQVISS